MRTVLSALVLGCLLVLPATAQDKEKKEPDLKSRLKAIKGPFTLIVHFKVKKGEEDKVADAAKPCIAATRKEKGCLAYELHQDAEDPTKFIFFEKWKSPEALQEHLGAEHTKKLLTALAKIGDGRSKIMLGKSIGD